MTANRLTPVAKAGPLAELADCLESLQAPAEVAPLIEAALGRIRRDLLPRADSSGAYVVAAIVGPNNSGKSTLFNSLLGQGAVWSPASAAGGFTRVCVGAVHPKSRAGLEASLGRRFDLAFVDSPSLDAKDVQASGPPERLLLHECDRLPPSVVLIDAPDFDSVFGANRDAGEALLVTADLLVAVVTGHTYQNRACVDFFERAVRHGRPYVLVYNEAVSEDVAREHTRKLVSDLGRSPVAMFFNLLDLAVSSGAAVLRPEALTPGDGDLESWLFTGGNTETIVQAARAASLAELSAELSSIDAAWADAVQSPKRLHSELRNRLHGHAEAAARALFPLAPFREALQRQLDERSTLHRGLRFLPQQLNDVVRVGYDAVLRLTGGTLTSRSPADAFRDAELARLLGSQQPQSRAARATLEPIWEALAKIVGSEDGVVSDDAKKSDFDRSQRDAIAARLVRCHEELELPFEDFGAACDASIAAELDQRGDELGLQWLYTALNLLPPVAAVTVMALTGVVGDVGAGVAYLTAQPLLDRAVGREFVSRVHASWWRPRTEVLIDLLEQALAPASTSELRELVEGYENGLPSLAAKRTRVEEGDE